MKPMKVILLKDEKKLGKRGEVKEVAAGFARNFLIPKKLAALATEMALKQLAEKMKREQSKLGLEKEKSLALFKKLHSEEIVLKVKANPQGKIFGSLHSVNILSRLKEVAKKDISPLNLELNEPIKTVGEYSLPVKFKGEELGQIKIKVLALENEKN